MSKLLSPTKVKFFYSVLIGHNLEEAEVDKIMLESFSCSNKFYPEFNPLLCYYSSEMGEGLKRVIYYSDNLYIRDEFVSNKLKATNIEIDYSNAKGQRSLNIDVGLLAKEQVLLATGKPYSHRIYLSDGVYAELVYFYQNKSFQKVPWTYPDYQDQEKIEFFNSIR